MSNNNKKKIKINNNHFFSNKILNISLIFTVIISMLILYVPSLQKVLHMGGLRLRWAMLPIPFAWFIFLFDEMRRFIIRKYPNGLFYKFTYY